MERWRSAATAPQPAPSPADERAAMTPDEFMDFTRPLPDRPYDEQYDNQSDVERDPCGAWVAIQHMAHHLAWRQAETLQQLADLGQTADRHGDGLIGAEDGA